MGKLLEFATATEKPLRSRFGRWMLEVSKAVDAVVAGTINLQSLLLPEQSSPPAAVPNAGVVFTQDVNGIAELFFREDNGTVIQLTSNGQTLAYVTQTDWGVNPQTGNDVGPGTSAAPLRTLGELARRWSGKTFSPSLVNVTVTLSGTFAVSDVLVLSDATFPGPTVITVQGTMATVASGSVTAYTAMSPATGVRAALTDAAQDFTPQLRRRIRMTSGAANTAVTWVCSLGGGVTVANVGQFTTDNAFGGTTVNPGIGDTYVIETFTTIILGYHINVPGSARVALRDIEFQAASSVNDGGFVELNKDVLHTRLYGCHWTMAGFNSHVVVGNQTFIANGFVWDTNNASGVTFKPGQYIEASCCWFAFSQTAACYMFGQNNIHDGNGTLHVGRYISNDSEQEDINHRGFFGCINGTLTELVRIDDFAQWSLSTASARFWGAAGNTVTNALRVRNGCGMVYTTLPTATGATPTSDVVLSNAAAIAWAALPALAVSPNNAFANVRQ